MKLSFVIKHSLFIFFILFISILNAQKTKLDSIQIELKPILTKAKTLRYTNFETSNEYLKEEYNKFIDKGDSIKAIHILIERATNFSHKANYNKSYDILWRSLIISDKIKNESLKATIYLSIGRLYSFFHKKEEAFKYLDNSLKINQKLVQSGALEPQVFANNYYNFTTTYRDLKDFKNAQKYLDSCFLYYKNNDELDFTYLKFEKANIYLEQNKINQALSILQEIEPWFQKNEPSYLVLVYTSFGDTYTKQSQTKIGEEYYHKALSISKKYNAHIDYTPLIYEKLANLYIKIGDYKLAYEHDHEAKLLDAKFFDSRSSNNRSLLEIKDTYLFEKQQQDAVQKEEQLAKLKQEDRILMLQRVILFVGLTSTLIIGLLYLMFVKSKHKGERKLQELELIKSNESLELRNKELAGFALQLAEKDEFLRELKSKLRVGNEKINIDEIKQISKSITVSNERSWQEFRLRFTAVNEVFYNKLTAEYPKLSQRDQKICAFIKLNLSSKKMASLLGISVESVHTIRYRLRKKLNLASDVNLEDFIANL